MEVEERDQVLQGAYFALLCRLFCMLRIWCCIHVRFVLLVSSMYHSPKPPGVWPGRNPRLTERKASVPVVESPSSRKGTSRTSFVTECWCCILVPVCFLRLVSSMHCSLEPPGLWHGSSTRQLGHKAPVPVVKSTSPRNGTSRTSFMKQWDPVRSN